MSWTSNPSSACSRRKRSVNGLPLVVLQVIYHHMLLAELPFRMEFVLVERGMRKVTLIATPMMIFLLLLRPLSLTWPRHLMKLVCVSKLALVRPLLLLAFIFFLLVLSVHTVMEMLSAVSSCGPLPLHSDGSYSGAPGATSAFSAECDDSELNEDFAEAVLREHVCAEAVDFHCLKVLEVGPRIATRPACRFFPRCARGDECTYSHLSEVSDHATADEHARLSNHFHSYADTPSLSATLWHARAAGHSVPEVYAMVDGESWGQAVIDDTMHEGLPQDEPVQSHALPAGPQHDEPQCGERPLADVMVDNHSEFDDLLREEFFHNEPIHWHAPLANPQHDEAQFCWRDGPRGLGQDRAELHAEPGKYDWAVPGTPFLRRAELLHLRCCSTALADLADELARQVAEHHRSARTSSSTGLCTTFSLSTRASGTSQVCCDIGGASPSLSALSEGGGFR
ncbi:unnamed protein product [Prorocentrum cordatum]|uniref:C3H1-type domain-containing protein n=1 Tax=Prorocentrum cordatum TaxID=2364126 RepID=A0ABN9US05_9DINO|nr:unnamed protein product [Polarella glacialis]